MLEYFIAPTPPLQVGPALLGPLSAAPSTPPAAAFLFLYFLKTFFYKNIFLVSHFTVLYPYRPAGGGRDLYVNKYIFFLRGDPWREPAAPLLGGRHSPPARQGGAGSPQI